MDKTVDHPPITKEILQSLFYYKDGFLYNKRHQQGISFNSKAGSVRKYKNRAHRKYIKVNEKIYSSSRLIFLYHHGYFPKCVDHKDRNTMNDRIENLRASTIQQNTWNITSHKNSTSKYLGVSLKKGKYWQATILIDGVNIHIGSFKTENEAAIAYNLIAIKHRGEFVNLNIIEN